jgi:hypothetical protein
LRVRRNVKCGKEGKSLVGGELTAAIEQLKRGMAQSRACQNSLYEELGRLPYTN